LLAVQHSQGDALVAARAIALDIGGLTLLPADPRRAVWAGLISIVAVTAFIVALDVIAGHPAPYVGFYTSPLWPRTPLIAALAITEEVKFRLVLMTAMVWLVSIVRRPVPAWWIVAAIILSQFANVWAFVVAEPIYGSLRYWLVGCVWGWLYWKHGFVTAAAAHGACHLLLDPALKLTLS
jgi:hypothetical protein